MSFGTQKKQTIYNAGIKTAADIQKLNVIKIPGIGPKNIQILFDWQRQIGNGFVYKPNYNVINQEVNTVARNLKARQKQLETEIKTEYRTVNVLKTDILNSQKQLSAQYDPLAKKLYQAELDLKAFQKIYS